MMTRRSAIFSLIFTVFPLNVLAQDTKQQEKPSPQESQNPQETKEEQQPDISAPSTYELHLSLLAAFLVQPNFETNEGIDLNSDGQVTTDEKIPDTDKDGKISEKEVWEYYRKHEKEIDKLDSGIEVKAAMIVANIIQITLTDVGGVLYAKSVLRYNGEICETYVLEELRKMFLECATEEDALHIGYGLYVHDFEALPYLSELYDKTKDPIKRKVVVHMVNQIIEKSWTSNLEERAKFADFYKKTLGDKDDLVQWFIFGGLERGHLDFTFVVFVYALENGLSAAKIKEIILGKKKDEIMPYIDEALKTLAPKSRARKALLKIKKGLEKK